MNDNELYDQPIVMEEQPVEEWLNNNLSNADRDQVTENESEDDDSGYSTDELDDIYESQLLDAQQQWDESIEQLNKVLNWILLPVIGKFMGRRVAKTIWQRVMEYLWK